MKHVEGRGKALWGVLTRKKILVDASPVGYNEKATHRFKRSRKNLIRAFSQGIDAHLNAVVVDTGGKYLYRHRTNLITFAGELVSET